MIRFAARITLLLAVVAMPALAQNYPTKQVTLLVPFAAGGPTDTVARQLAQVMGKSPTIGHRRNAAGAVARCGHQRKERCGRRYTLLIAISHVDRAFALSHFP